MQTVLAAGVSGAACVGAITRKRGKFAARRSRCGGMAFESQIELLDRSTRAVMRFMRRYFAVPSPGRERKRDACARNSWR